MITHRIDEMRARRILFSTAKPRKWGNVRCMSSLRLDEKFSSQRAEGTGTTDVPPPFPPGWEGGKEFSVLT